MGNESELRQRSDVPDSVFLTALKERAVMIRYLTGRMIDEIEIFMAKQEKEKG